MSILRTTGTTLCLAVCLALGASCSQKIPPPTPLAVEQMPTELPQAFAKANAEAKDLVNQVLAAMTAKDYSKAFAAIQSLAALPGLSKQQQRVAGGALMTINNLLQTAQTQGDANATETLKTYRVNK
jgi:TorA maturation chaperone TorD